MEEQNNSFSGVRIIRQNDGLISRRHDEQQFQQIVCSPMAANDQQVYYQVHQQQLPQSPQHHQSQIFYQIPANQNVDNQNLSQPTIILNRGNLQQHPTNQQQKIVLQPKVVVQRNGDLTQQESPQMIQIENRNQQPQLQYNFLSQIDQNSGQPLIIQQPQLKQVFTQQSGQQVVMQPQFFNPQQQGVVHQVAPKIVMQAPQRYTFIQRPQQQVQQILPTNSISGGQVIQINNQQQSNQDQPKILPRIISTTPNTMRVRLQNANQQKVMQMNVANRAKNVGTPRQMGNAQRLPVATNVTASQASPVRPTTPGRTIYILQQNDNSQVFVNQQNGQLIRMVPQKVFANRSPIHSQATQSSEPSNVVPSTSTLTVRKNSEGDLEDSIAATAISKASKEPPPLVVQRNAQSRMGLAQHQQAINNFGQTKAVTKSPGLQIIRTRNPTKIMQNKSTNPSQERESAKMLVILTNGEQRLITFTLPKETCTVLELLEQVGIHVEDDSSIECIENHQSEIDYVVKVGNFGIKDTYATVTKAAENHIKQRQQQQNQQKKVVTTNNDQTPKPELKLPAAKYVEGFSAVCGFCGFTGPDHAKCERCHRIFLEEPKRIPHPRTDQIVISNPPPKLLTIQKSSDKKDQLEAIQKRHQMALGAKNNAAVRNGGRIGMVTSLPVRPNPRIVRTKKPAIVETVTLSSDDETEDEKVSKKSENTNIGGNSSTGSMKSFAPEILEDVVSDDFERKIVTEFSEGEQKIETNLSCRSIRIGSYKFDSKENVIVTSKGMKITAPNVREPKELIILHIQQSEIMKVVVHFSKPLNIVFLYLKPSCAKFICEQLQFTSSNDTPQHTFSPTSPNEEHKKIVMILEPINEQAKSILRSIYVQPILEEISNKDANDLLVKSSGFLPTQRQNNNLESNSITETVVGLEIKKLFIYPPGRGGIPISTHDYLCLGTDQYLNDVIIDFYLKYIEHEHLTENQRSRVHIFSQFFYKRLTTLTRDKDQKLSAAEKRWKRVSSWTKNVNIFEKDFVIVPINEQSHWFLAIICFPYLKEPHTMDSNQPIKLLPMNKKKKIAEQASLQIGNTTITPLSKKEETVPIPDDESERDEAEGDESDMESTNETDEEVIDKGQAVKVPCILIFDSLIGAPRSRVVATLRDYLTCEHKAKYPDQPPRHFSKDNLFGSQVKVPQQNNFTDCGLFLLQYVEQFFKDPIKDFRLPIKTLSDWFHHDLVTKKREEIAKLIDEIAKRDTPEGVQLPEISFPTKDGVILETKDASQKSIDSAFEETAEMTSSLEERKENDATPKGNVKRVYISKKRSIEKTESLEGQPNPKIMKIVDAKNESK